MAPNPETNRPRKPKTALVAFRRQVYTVSPNGLRAMMELTRGPVDRDAAIGFVLRQEGYEIHPDELAVP